MNKLSNQNFIFSFTSGFYFSRFFAMPKKTALRGNVRR